MAMTRYSPEQREQALLLARKIGTTAASKDLGIPKTTISSWQSRAKTEPANDSPIPEVQTIPSAPI